MNSRYLDGLNSEIRKQARFIDSRKEVIPLEKSVLIQYCDMQAEIKELRRLIKMTEERLEKIEQEGAVSDVVSGGMGGIQHFTVEGFPVPGYTKAKNLLISRKQRLKMKEEELLELTNQAEEYIESIEKSELRIMFRLYYIEGLTWAKVAARMNSLFPKRKVAYTEENCRKRNFRFFEENLKMSPNVPSKCDKV
jgi:hypothetical protein